MQETEADTRANRIDPVLRAAGWGVVEGAYIRREAICPGRIMPGGQRGAPLSADYVFEYRGHKLATMEAKRHGKGAGAGVGQAKDYSTRLKARFAYASDGAEWYEVDMHTGKEGAIAPPFPTPEELWQRCFPTGNAWRERFGAVPFETGGGKWQPRYYQHNAITAVLEAIAKDQQRILLTLATGTGKTSIAFLTPFKVRQMASTMDTYTFSDEDEVVSGEIDPDKEYTEADFNTKLIIDEREMSRVCEFMDQIDQRQKTLVFCATQDHAARVRNFINQVKTNPDPHYCERVTADDGKLGEQHLREFQDNEKTLPTILTTSQKLSTGVDARNVRNIVLLRPVKSMIEFKQIIGRGTRTFDGKDFFTIYDFVKAYEHFNDPEWDGEPEEPVAGPGGPKPPKPPEPPDGGDPVEPCPPVERVVVKLADGKERKIQYVAETTYWFNGRQITAREFMEQLFGDLGTMVGSADELRAIWTDPDRRTAFIQSLEEMGYDRDRMDDMRRLIDAPKSDIFDVLAYVRFTLDPLSRSERVEGAKASGLGGYEAEMRDFLSYILQAYELQGIDELAPHRVSDFLQIRYGGTNDAKRVLGSIPEIRGAFIDIQKHLFS